VNLPTNSKEQITATAQSRFTLQIPDGLEALDDVIVSRMVNPEDGFLFAAVALRKTDKHPMLFWAIGKGDHVQAQAVTAHPSDKGTLKLLSAQNVGGDIILIDGVRLTKLNDRSETRLWRHLDSCAIITSTPDVSRPFSVGQWKEFDLPKAENASARKSMQ
jgi:hypothetical protein